MRGLTEIVASFFVYLKKIHYLCIAKLLADMVKRKRMVKSRCVKSLVYKTAAIGPKEEYEP